MIEISRACQRRRFDVHAPPVPRDATSKHGLSGNSMTMPQSAAFHLFAAPRFSKLSICPFAPDHQHRKPRKSKENLADHHSNLLI